MSIPKRSAFVAVAVISAILGGLGVAWWGKYRPLDPATTRLLPTSSYTHIGGIPGPEDLVVDRNEGRPRLLVSSSDRTEETREGAIFQIDPGVDPAGDPPRVSRMKIDWNGVPPRRFKPHGLALATIGGQRRLFAINHQDRRNGVHTIEVFQVEAEGLRFESRIRGGGLVNPNDLAVRPLSGDRWELFVSNPPQGKGALLWEKFVGPGDSFVARMQSGQAESSRMGGFRYPNGVAVIGDALYVSSTLDERIFVYPLAEGSEPARTSIDLDAAVDNLTVEDSNTLLAAASRSASAFASYAKAWMGRERPLPLSPTIVWRVTPGSTPRTSILYEDDGSQLSGGSAAVCLGRDLYIGQVFSDFVLRVAGGCVETRR